MNENFNVTFDDLCAKIGKLVVENEMLYKRVQELQADLVKMREKIDSPAG
jgi:hypothetical protein